MAKTALVGAALSGLVADLLRREVFPELEVTIRPAHHHAFGRRAGQPDGLVFHRCRSAPRVTLNFDHVEQLAVERNSGVEIVDDETGMVDSAKRDHGVRVQR